MGKVKLVNESLLAVKDLDVGIKQHVCWNVTFPGKEIKTIFVFFLKKEITTPVNEFEKHSYTCHPF